MAALPREEPGPQPEASDEELQGQQSESTGKGASCSRRGRVTRGAVAEGTPIGGEQPLGGTPRGPKRAAAAERRFQCAECKGQGH